MEQRLQPADEKQLVEILQGALAANTPLEVVGRGTRRMMGRPVQAAAVLDLGAFSGVELYEPEELILEAGAATPLADIENLLATRGQQLAFEPPDLSGLFESANGGSLGGIMACNLSGPRRIQAGAARDHILGIRGVSGRGEAFKGGARVVKNVTGYDLPKLMAGSWGTLAALTTVTVKVLPRPETEETVLLAAASGAVATQAMSTAMKSSCEVSAAAYLPAGPARAAGQSGACVALRLEGVKPSVIYRRDKLLALLKGQAEVLAAEQSRGLWRAIRNVALLDVPGECSLWRISVAPSRGAEILAAVPGARGYLDWAGGLVWLVAPAAGDGCAVEIRRLVDSGHATLFRAPADLRASVNVFHPQPEALALLSGRVKRAFDPAGILNPGRMYSGH